MPANIEKSKAKNLTITSAPDFGPPIIYDGKPVITLSMMDKAHEKPSGTAKRNFHQNRKYLKKDVHFFEVSVKSDEIRSTSLNEAARHSATGKVILLTERGYLMLVRCFRGWKAWAIQDLLVETYFRAKTSAIEPAGELAVSHALPREMLLEIVEGVRELALARRVRPGKATRRKHWRVLVGKRMGVCPSCGRGVIASIIDKPGQWLSKVAIERFFNGPHRGLEHTWPVCWECHGKLNNGDFAVMSREKFGSYQSDVGEWLAENEPEIIRR